MIERQSLVVFPHKNTSTTAQHAPLCHSRNTAAAPTQSLCMPSMHATSRHQHRNYETIIIAHGLLPRDDQPTSAEIYLGIPALHRREDASK